jgi:hypothetical protein
MTTLDSVIKRGGLVPLEIQLSRGGVWCLWRFSYQEGRFGVFGDSVIKRGGLVPLEIQLSRGEVWCLWRFSYQEGRFGAVGDSVIKRGGLEQTVMVISSTNINNHLSS